MVLYGKGDHMTKSRHKQYIERGDVLNKYYDHLMPRYEKQVIKNNVTKITRTIRERNKNAGLGQVGALEILYQLGRFLNEIED